MERKRPGRWAVRAAEALDVPAYIAPSVPLIELCGDGRLRVENHRGILAYDPREIHIATGSHTVRVMGDGMEIKAMNREELVLRGIIWSVELI